MGWELRKKAVTQTYLSIVPASTSCKELGFPEDTEQNHTWSGGDLLFQLVNVVFNGDLVSAPHVIPFTTVDSHILTVALRMRAQLGDHSKLHAGFSPDIQNETLSHMSQGQNCQSVAMDLGQL